MHFNMCWIVLTIARLLARYCVFQQPTLRRRIAGGNKEETMEEIKDNYVTTDREYIAELEEKAKRVDWLGGYIEGVDDTLNHLVELFQAYKGN